MSKELPITVCIQHADGHSVEKKAADIEDIIYMLEEYAADCIDCFGDDELAKMFPMQWSAYEQGSDDVLVVGMLNDDMSVSPN